MSRAEDLWIGLGRRMGWSVDKCEELVEEYDRDEYKADREEVEESEDGA